METPKIKDITTQRIVEEIKAKAPFFVPEWLPDDTDPGLALSRIFAEMYKSITERLNRALYRHYLSFLETIDTKLLQPQAEAPVVFVPSEGAAEDITVPASTKVAGKDSEGESVVFETEKTFVVTPSKLRAIFSFIPETDTVYDHSDMIDGKASLNIFTGEDLQRHVLYIGEPDVLNVKRGLILLKITGKGIEKLADSNVQWEYIPEDDGECSGSKSLSVKKLEWKDKKLILTLEKEDTCLIKETEIGGIKSRWIYCRYIRGKDIVAEIEIESIKVSVEPVAEKANPETNTYGISGVITENVFDVASVISSDETYSDTETGEDATAGISPDLVFVNDVPVNPERFYPFGHKPKLYDTCYIGSEEVFSKKDYKITLNFTLEPGSGDSPNLSWEYWDGEGWIRLETETDENLTSGASKEIRIDGLPEIKKTTVNGKENHWIRVRLVGGDYGKEYVIEDDNVVEGTYCPPCIMNLKLGYSSINGGHEPQHLLTENNLQMSPQEVPFRPFEFLSDKHPALYLCFSAPLKRGPYSLYVEIDRYYAYPESEKPPTIKWQYYGSDGWKNLDVVDDTMGLTRSGTIMISPENETAALTLFGIEDGYWIRGVIIDTPWSLKELSEAKTPLFGTKPLYIPEFTIPRYLSILSIAGSLKYTVTMGSERDAEEETLEGAEEPSECEEFPLAIKDLAKKEIKRVPPLIKGVYLNTAMAVQMESIDDETLGSGTGQAGESFRTARTPVIDETLWVDELNSLSESERSELRKSPDKIQEQYSEDGELTGFWVRWSAVDSFVDSTPSDRHYMIDRVSGEVVFGDGEHGMIPPAGSDNIRISYRTGGGERGNISAGEIKELQSSLPSIDSVYNPVASAGGCDTEDTEALLGRGSRSVRHRNRAVFGSGLL
ncbi:MAG: hypothetical protein GXO97_02305 [Nitrospirae bacterium]|nr:hypothetical protein [Nitrospirota bacterium]